MLLKNLIKTKLSSFENTQISDLVLDSRKAKKGKCSDPNCDTTMFRIL